MNGGNRRYWVLIETGANQAYIFGTNRLRHVVGASYLVREVGVTWVPQEAARHNAEVVLAISGKALLLADDPDAGRSVIGAVSEKALKEAPGLEVTGVVGPGFDPALSWHPGDDAGSRPIEDGALSHVQALAATYELLELARMRRPSALLRDPALPWFEVCRESGFPVAGIEEDHPDGGLVASSVLAKSLARFAARERMRELFADQPEVVPENGDDLSDDGWIAVIHADGNGIGRVFAEFPERALTYASGQGGAEGGLSLQRHKELLAGFTGGLENATETALGLAARDATRGQQADGTVLPVVCGGDDVTIVCHARFALGLARGLVLAFQEQAAASGLLTGVAGRRLTAAAGIAFVKPHHPFAAAYALAEELTASAKQVVVAGGGEVSALDFHVAFESTLADLATLRRRMGAAGLARHGGPYVVTGPGGPEVGERDIARLDRAMATAAMLSSSMAHDLREGLALGEAEYLRRLDLAALSPDRPKAVSPDDVRDLAPVTIAVPRASQSGVDGPPGAAEPGAGEPGEKVVRLLDALLLTAIAKPRAGAPTGGDSREAEDTGVAR